MVHISKASNHLGYYRAHWGESRETNPFPPAEPHTDSSNPRSWSSTESHRFRTNLTDTTLVDIILCNNLRSQIMPIDPNQLADEIHDTVIQELSAVLLMLEINESHFKENPDLAHTEMERIKDQIRSTLQELRNMISYLKSEA